MTGIHHTAPSTYLRATRQQTDTAVVPARRPSRLLLAVRRLARRASTARPTGWVDVTPAAAAR